MGGHLHHIEVFLRDQVPFHPKAELIAAWGGKHQRGNIDAEVRNLQSITDDNAWKSGSTDELFGVEIHQVDFELVRAFGVGETEIEAHVLMLEWKAHGLQMREQPDQALLFRGAVLDDVIADEKRLNAGFDDVRHEPILRESDLLSKGCAFHYPALRCLEGIPGPL